MRAIIRRLGMVGGVSAAVLALAATPAFSHVTVEPDEAEQGGYASVRLRVPNESDTAGTVRVQLELPKDTPFASVSTRPVEGWRVELDKQKLPEPVTVGDVDVSEAVRTVTWSAKKGARIGPDEFQEFGLSIGPLPEATSVSLPATQTYDDGEVVAWDQPVRADDAEPERPAPTLTLTTGGGHGGSGHHGAGSSGTTEQGPAADASSGDPDQAGSVGTALAVGVAGLIVGALGLLAGGYALVVVRRGRGERSS